MDDSRFSGDGQKCAGDDAGDDLTVKSDKVKKGLPGWGRILVRTVAWIAGITVILMAVVQITLSPALLTRVINNAARDYIDGNVEFGKVSVSAIKSFPFLNVTLDSVVVTYPSERYAEYENDGQKAFLMKMGESGNADTLASFSKFSVSVDLPALIGGNIHIPNIWLSGPRIFAKSYNDSTANWNIFKTGTQDVEGNPEDSAKAGNGLPKILLERISLDGRPFIVFCSREDTLFAALNLKEMKFRGRFATYSPERNRIGFMVDSLFIGGRYSGDTLAFALQKLRMREQKGDFSLKAKAGAALATRSFGRVFLPVEIDSRVSFLKDTVPSLTVRKLTANIAGLPVDLQADLRFCTDSIRMSGNAAVKDCKVNDILRFWGRNLIPALSDLKTDAVISMEASFDGWYNMDGSMLPEFDIRLRIPESPVSYSSIRMESNLAADIWAKGGGDAPVDAGINDFHMKGRALDISLKGSGADLLGKDPLFDIDGSLNISLDTLKQYIRKSTGMDVSGRLDAMAKGKIRMSQINPYTFADADLAANLRSDRLAVHSGKDSIDLHIDSLKVFLATTDAKYDRAVTDSRRTLALVVNLDSTSVRYKDAFSVTGKSLSLKAQNDAAILDNKDSSSYYPFGGRLDIGKLALTDADSNRVVLVNSANTFRISPSKADKEIPVLSLKSDSRAIGMKYAFNRAGIRDLDIDIVATKSDIRRKRMAKAFVDSLVRRFPDVPRDSLFSHLKSLRGQIKIPDWLSEQDFRKNDLNFKLSGSLAKYFREWDFYGGVKFKKTAVMTPQFPLRTSFDDFDGYITNDEFTLKSFTLKSGRSDLKASGKLSGLRRALLNNGPVSLALSIDSDSLNINQLLGAYSFGKKFSERADSLKTAASTANDREYENMVVVDTLTGNDITETALIVVPANLVADVKIKAGNVLFAKMDMDTLTANMKIKERCVQLTEINASSNVGSLSFDGFYSTRTKRDISAGFSLNLMDITAEKIIEMMPAVDTLMPMLQSFYGNLDCELAATAQIDTTMNIIMPSLNGVLRIKGKDLALVESEDLYKIAKILKFKDIHNIHIDDMSVEGVIGNNKVEIFPFVLTVDRYSMALSGIQGLDQSFRYHISILKSPLLIRFGVDLWGDDFDNMKFRIGRAKYKDANVPVFSSVIDQTRLNLLESIRNIFTKGVDAAVRENESQQAIEGYKEKIDYSNAAETDMESLSPEEEARLESDSEADSAAENQ